MVIFVTKLALIFLHSRIKVRTASESNDLIYSTSPHLYKVILHKIRHILSKTLKMLTGFFNVVCAYFTLSKHDVLFKELNPFLSRALIAQPHRPSTLCQRSRARAFFLLGLTLDLIHWPYHVHTFRETKGGQKNWNKKQNLTFSKLQSKMWHRSKIIRISPITNTNTDYKALTSTHSLAYAFT